MQTVTCSRKCLFASGDLFCVTVTQESKSSGAVEMMFMYEAVRGSDSASCSCLRVVAWLPRPIRKKAGHSTSSKTTLHNVDIDSYINLKTILTKQLV